MSDERPPTDKDTTNNIFKGPNGKFRLPELPKTNNLKLVFTGKGNWFDYFQLTLLVCMFIPQTIWYAWPVSLLLIMYENHLRDRAKREAQEKEIRELKAQNICTSCKRPL